MTNLDTIAAGALSSRETVYATYDICRLAIERGVPGDFVECGVFGGANAAAMAKAVADQYYPLSDSLKWRRVHLFDSFTGVPAPSEHDKEWIAAGYPVGQSACSPEDVQRNMRQWGIPDELLVYHQGMLQYTTPIAAMNSRVDRPGHLRGIAVLRLDCDLYESTRVCLEQLYPFVWKGGWIICDDFALDGCRKAVDDFMRERKYPPVYWQKGD